MHHKSNGGNLWPEAHPFSVTPLHAFRKLLIYRQHFNI